MAGILRPGGRAGSNTAADHIELLDLAVAQIPDTWRDKPIRVRSDRAGFSHALLTYLPHAPGCRHDHRLRHDGGWRLTHTRPGHFTWTSRLANLTREARALSSLLDDQAAFAATIATTIANARAVLRLEPAELQDLF